MQSEMNVMPHSLEAERSVLGCMLVDGEAAYLAQESLVPEDFYSAAHREIYGAMQAVHSARKPIDLVTVADEQNLIESHRIVRLRVELFHKDNVALLNTILLATGLNDCVHALHLLLLKSRRSLAAFACV